MEKMARGRSPSHRSHVKPILMIREGEGKGKGKDKGKGKGKGKGEGEA